MDSAPPPLTRQNSPKLWAIIDEAAARRLVGGRQVMSEQLARLRKAAAQPNITTQLIPFDLGAHSGMDGSFVVLEFRNNLLPTDELADSWMGSRKT